MSTLSGKRIKETKLSLDEEMHLDLCRLAVIDGRKLADFINHVLALYLYGAIKPTQSADEMAERIRESYGL